jgi:hypothetical protein
MEKKNNTTVKMLLRGAVSVAILLLSLALLQDQDGSASSGMFSAALMLAWTVYEALNVSKLRRGPKRERLLHLIRAAIYLLCTVLLLIGGTQPGILRAAGLAFALALAIDRIFAILEKRSVKHAVLNILMIAMLFLIFLPAYDAFGIAAIVSVFLAMKQILSLAFSRINVSVLKKIIRKTYAAEILFGMALLIVAVSIVLPGLEPEIKRFTDGLWYCFAIVTTIGFGDITATTGIGRLLSVILGLYGIIVVSLITSIIVNLYSEVKADGDTEDEDALVDTPDMKKETQETEES